MQCSNSSRDLKPHTPMSRSNPAQVVARRRFQTSDPAESVLPTPSINWRFLLNHTILYSFNHVNRWRWRGDLGGVLPDGFDASSVAAEAIYLLLKDPPPWNSLSAPESCESPMAAIVSATRTSAEIMGWSDRVGTVERGKFADIIAVAGDPLRDISELERVSWVMKGGVIYKGQPAP